MLYSIDLTSLEFLNYIHSWERDFKHAVFLSECSDMSARDNTQEGHKRTVHPSWRLEKASSDPLQGMRLI
jgi:hypothetical protein